MSVDELSLAELNYPKAPLMRTAVPGPQAQSWLARSLEVESMARGAGRFPLVFAGGRGSTVLDPDGNVFIDLAAGVAVSSVGRLHPRVTAAMKAQIDELMHAADLSSIRRTELAEKVSSIMPNGLRDNCITYFTQSGSSAVETALKFIRIITGRRQIVAFHGAYHGVTTSAGSLTTGERYHQGNLHIPDVIHVPYPYGYRCALGGTNQRESEDRCADYLDYVLNTPYTAADDVAAVILEPIQGEGGYIAPSPYFLAAGQGDLREERLPLRLRRGPGRRRPQRDDVGRRGVQRRAGRADVGQGHGWGRPHGRAARSARTWPSKSPRPSTRTPSQATESAP